jgi:hypothetical protein
MIPTPTFAAFYKKHRTKKPLVHQINPVRPKKKKCKTHFKMINLPREQKREIRRKPLLKHRTDFPCRIQLRFKRRHPQIPFSANGRYRITFHRSRDELQVCGDVDLRREFMIVRRLEESHRLELRRRYPGSCWGPICRLG